MAQKRTRKPIPVPSHEELMEGRKRLKPYKPKPKPKVKPKPPKRGDKKFNVEKPIYRGESLGKGKSSQEV